MGLFNKKKKVADKPIKDTKPTLPELPKLPELDSFEPNNKSEIHQLPSFPSSSYGDKFSQDSIKEAVSGKRGGYDEDVDDFSEEGMMRPSQIKRSMEIEEGMDVDMDEDVPTPSKKPSMIRTSSRETEPIFVRIDKFEEGLKLLKNAKGKISEIEETLHELKRIREKEEQELNEWASNVRSMKSQIEKVDRDIFSKI